MRAKLSRLVIRIWLHLQIRYIFFSVRSYEHSQRHPVHTRTFEISEHSVFLIGVERMETINSPYLSMKIQLQKKAKPTT